MDEIISINDLVAGYDSKKRDLFRYGPVTTKIKPGDMTVIVGRNGIGKSSLLRTISALQEPLSGMVSYYGTDARDYSRHKLSMTISFVSTEQTGLGNMKVMEMVALGRYPYTNWLGSLDDNDRRMVHEAMRQTGISKIQDKFVYQLSDGERQKSMIARALAQDTPVIILDEPTAFLDLPSRHDILRMLGDLTLHSGKTILFSTHDLDIAMQEADRIWLMTDSGIYEGAPEDLLINELFSKLFMDSSFYYDRETDVFRLKREMKGDIYLCGNSDYFYYTVRAMERSGFLRSNNESSKMVLTVKNQDAGCSMAGSGMGSGVIWHLRTGDNDIRFSDLYSLSRYLKRL